MAELSKTPEEIKKGLECRILGSAEKCDHKCSTCHLFVPGYLYPEIYKDALALIQQLERDKAWASENYDLIREENKRLEAQNAELLEKIKQLEKERDAAIYDLKKTRECTTCEYVKKPPSELPCVSCGIILKNYEWRGPCEENGGN